MKLRIFLPFLLAVILGLSPHAQNLDAAWRSARLAEENNQPGAEAKYLRQVVAMDPWRYQLWEKIGQLEMTARNYKGAAEAYQWSDLLGNISLSGKMALGKVFLLNGDDQAAVNTWLSIIQNGTAPADIYRQTSELQRKMGDLAGARQTLSAWLALDANQVQVQYTLGLLSAVSDPQTASQLLLEAEKADQSLAPKVNTLRQAIGAATFENDESLRKVIIGRTLGDLGEWDLAADAFTQAIQLTPGYSEAWAFLGEANQHLGKDGLPELNRAQLLNPDSVITQALTALYWRRQGEPKEALPHLYAVMIKEPDRAIWRIEIGNTLAEAGNLNSALTYYQAAVRIEPTNSLYWQTLAKFCGEKNIEVHTVGFPAARQALLLTPDDPAALDLMGWLFLTQGDYDSAERFLLRALQQNDTYAVAHLHLGQVYMQEGKDGPANDQLSQAINLAKDDPAVANLAQRLLQQISAR